jgi:signal peptide peptidase SppA
LAATVKAVDARIDPRTERSIANRQGAVAVVPVLGVITPRPSILEMYGLAVSTVTIGRRVRAALDDPEVKAVVLDVDSPGGVISGVPELAAEIRAARGGKPIVAQANHLMASAAYWIASAADEIVASPSALVGSVGVYAMHVDQSAYLEQMGLKVTLIAEPAEKIEDSPFAPLSAEAEAVMRDRVATGLAMFRADVSQGRNIARTGIADSWARVFRADETKGMTMIDKVRTLEGTLAAYGVSQEAPRPSQASRQRGQAVRQAQLDAMQAEFQALGVCV